MSDVNRTPWLAQGAWVEARRLGHQWVGEEHALLAHSRGDGPADLAFAAGPGIRRLISGELPPDRAIATGVVEVLHGPGDLLHRFADTFHLAA